MKKIYLLFILFFAFTQVSFGQLTEDFDTGLANAYTTGTQTLDSGDWYTSSVYQEVAGNSRGGSGHAARLNDDTPGASLRTPALNTAGVVTFYYRELNSGGGTFSFEKSYDNSSWSTLTTQAFSGNTYTLFTYDVNDNAATIYLRIVNDDNPGHLIIDDFSVTAPLPVELTKFTATKINDGVMLNWTTATEVNNYGFDVEAEVAGNWTNVGFVEGHGNSNAPKDYSYLDNSGATSYRLKQVDTDGSFEYSDVATVAGNSVNKLNQNYPNPFNPTTQISFSIAKVSNVNISVYNALGQKVVEILNQNMNPGNHTVNFDGSNLASGFYFYRLETPNYSKTMKMMLLK